MRIILLLLPLVFFAMTISADIRIQSDWNNGPGVYGPLNQWTDVFYQSDGICYTAMYDTLLLGMTASSQMVLPPGSGWATGLLSADFDLDGDVDLSCFLDTLLIYEHQLFLIENVDGAGTSWNLHRVSDVPIDVNHAATGDVDGDGYPDILAGQGYDTGDLRLYINSGGTGMWNEYVMNDGYEDIRFVDIADADGDGDRDLFFSTWSDTMLAWIENTGTTPGPGWPLHEIEIAGSLSFMDAVDIDQDGDIDVIANELCGCFALFENIDGSGLLWNKWYIHTMSNGTCAVADIDGDTDLDLVSRQGYWFENIDGVGHAWQTHGIYQWCYNHVFSTNHNGDDYIDFIVTSWPNTDNPGFTAVINRIPEGGRLLRSNYYEDFAQLDVITIDVDGDGIDEVAASENFNNGLFFWGFLGFEEDGCLESSVLNTGYDLIDWDSFSWSADVPSGTSVCFQIRGSDDYNQMGEWSDTLYTSGSGIGGILQSQDRYFQYRAIFSTTDIWNSACLDEVTVSFNPLSADPDPVNGNLFTISANPSGSVPVFDITLAETCNVCLQLFDISGRMVSTVFMGDLTPGKHSLYTGELNTGIYIARLSLNGEISTLRFIVLSE